jgi:uncharacterized protein YybS (DUF2232 family)
MGWAAPLAEGALSCLLFASSFWLPPFGFLACLLSPLPVAAAAWRSGPGAGALALAAGALAATLSTGLDVAAVYAFYFALGGLLLGLACRRAASPEVAVGLFAAVSIAAFWGTLGIQAAQAGTTPVALLAEGVRQSADHMRNLLRDAKAAPELIASAQAWADRFARGFPGAVAALSILVGWANGMGLRRIARSRGIALPPWNTWRAREGWIWILIGSGLLALLGKGTAATVALNVFIPALAVYFLQGLAIVHHLFEAKAFPRFLRALTYVLLFVQLPVMLLLAGVGAFDLWLDFRSRWSPPAAGART